MSSTNEVLKFDRLRLVNQILLQNIYDIFLTFDVVKLERSIDFIKLQE